MQIFLKRQIETKQGKLMIIFFSNDKLNMLLRLKFIQKIALLFTKKKLLTLMYMLVFTHYPKP